MICWRREGGRREEGGGKREEEGGKREEEGGKREEEEGKREEEGGRREEGRDREGRRKRKITRFTNRKSTEGEGLVGEIGKEFTVPQSVPKVTC